VTSGSEQPAALPGAALRSRRGMSIRERFRSKDSYGIVLILILLTLLATATIADSRWGRLVALFVQGGTLLFAQWTSAVRGRILRLTAILLALGLASAVVSTAPLGNDLSKVGAIVGAVLAASTIVIIGRRLGIHPSVSGSTILGAVCIYLLVGLTFAYVFAVLGLFDPPFFVQKAELQSIDLLYYSLVTLTTVGYGDFTAASSLGRMLSATEALTGQVYLVTVVALLVANIGHRRDVPASSGGGGRSVPRRESEAE
jgi:hypothetical protein